jgi:MFS transporter, putative metabolite:H+ symporter
MLSRTIVGSLILIAINTVIYGFVAWVPTFLVKQGMSIVSSLGFTTLMSLGGPVGALAGMWLGDHVGRKPVLVGFSSATIVLGCASSEGWCVQQGSNLPGQKSGAP